MNRAFAALCFTVLTVLAARGVAGVGPTPDREAWIEAYLRGFERMKSLSREALRAALESGSCRRLAARALARESAPGRFTSIGARPPALGPENALAATDRAAAAIKTSVDGAEAGVSVAPLALLGHEDEPNQVFITLAALKDAKARLGLAYGYELPWSPVGPDDLGLDRCGIDEAEKALAKKLRDARSALFRVCDEVVAWLVPGMGESERDEIRIEAALVCALPVPEAAVDAVFGEDGEPAMTLEMGIGVILDGLVEKERNRLREAERDGRPGAAAARFQLERRLFEVRDSVKVLEDLRAVGDCPCHDQETIEEAAKVAAWAHRRHRLGVGVTADLFPVILGFQPEGKETSRGQLQRWEMRAEYAMASGSTGFRVGVGIGPWRDTFTDPFHLLVSPSVSGAVLLGSLTREPLKDPQGRYRLVNGELPPRLVLGAELTVDVALARPASQVTALQQMTGTLFLDFLFSDEVAFRVGIPVRAETLVRAADPEAIPPVTEKRDLQWTFPLALITVIKM